MTPDHYPRLNNAPSLRPKPSRTTVSLAVQGALLSIAIGITTPAQIAWAAEEPAKQFPQNSNEFNIAPGPLDAALIQFATVADINLSYDAAALDKLNTKGLKGRYTTEAGLAALLQGSGLEATPKAGGGFALHKAAVSQSQPDTSVLPEVKVTAASDTPSPSTLPKDYAGGQVARGGRVGLLGNKDMQDTPFSATQYTAKLIEDQQARSIGDILINDPSIRNTYSRSSGRDEFNIRGFTLFNYDVMFNGLYGVSPRNSSSLIGIERVEVLRGPNALLNGMAPAGSVGGSINLVPKRAGATPLNRLTLSYMGESVLGAHVDVARRFGAEQQLGIRLNAITSAGETAVDNVKDNLDAIAIGMDFQGERLRLEGDFNYQHNVTRGRGGLLFPPASGVKIGSAPDADKNFIPKWTYWASNELAGALRAEFDLNKEWTVYGTVGGKEYDFNSLQTSMLLQNSQGGMLIRPYRLNESISALSFETGLRGKFTTGALEHEVVVSNSAFSQENRLLRLNGGISASSIYSPVNFAEPSLALSGHLQKVSEARLNSLAVADTISLMDRKVQLTLGARHQQVETSNFNGTTGARTDHYDKSDVTPAVALVIKPSDQLSFYGNYIEALSQGDTAPNGTSNAGQMFAPQVSKQHEAGLKYDFGRFASTLSLFQIERPAGFTNPTTNRYDMDGEQRNRGIELITQGEATDHVRVLGGLAWTQGKLTKTEAGTNDGNTAPAVPKLQFNLAGEWDPMVVEGLTLTARMVHTSPQYVDASNTQRIPTWTRYDLGARYAFMAGKTPITVRGSIENVFDKNYWLSAAREGLTVGAPRTLLLSVSADF